MFEIWQTTNQEPWTSALVDGAIKFKTRTQKPTVPIGAPVLLHASTRPWPDIYWLTYPVMKRYVEAMGTDTRGKVLGIGIMARVCLASDYPAKDRAPWNTAQGNCCAMWAWACSWILKLAQPVKARGFQVPFGRAKPETVKAVLAANPGVKAWLQTAGGFSLDELKEVMAV